MLMTPGLAFFYGGLVGRKNVLAIMIQSFVSMGWTTVLWWAFGFSLCFSGDLKSGTDSRDHRQLRLGVPAGHHARHAVALNDTIPMIVFCAYQMMFAIITPALITGAFTNRVTFKAYMLFLTVWLLFVYFPFVHMVWGGGILPEWGVLDFAGGIVVHNIAGIAALASVLYVGKRKVADRGPHSIPLVALGTGLLWFGWYGFNAGSEFRVDSVTAVAFLNTDIAASFAADHLARDGLDDLEEAEVPRPADRRRGRARDDHPGRRLRLARRPPRSSASSPASSASTPSRSRTSSAGTTRSTSGASTAWAASSASSCSAIFATTAFNPAGVERPASPATRPSSSSSAARSLISSVWAFAFTSACSGSSTGSPRSGSTEAHEDAASTRRSTARRPTSRGSSCDGDDIRFACVIRLGLALLLLATVALRPAPAAAQAAPPNAGDGTATSPAQPAPPAPEPWYASVTMNGFLSASYSYNFNRPDSGTNQYRVFDFDDNSFKIDVAELVLQRNPSKPGDGGFRVDLDGGELDAAGSRGGRPLP